MSFLTVCLNPVCQKTVVLDSLNIDHVNRSSKIYHSASGKGINVTRVLSQLNQDVTHITQLGYNNQIFLDHIKDEGLFIKTVPSQAKLRECTTLIDQKNNTVTEIVEEGDDVGVACENLILTLFKKEILRHNTLIISGSKAKGFSSHIFGKMVKEAKRLDKFVILDIRGEDLLRALPFKPDIIKPNIHEFLDTFLPEVDTNIPEEDLLPLLKKECKKLEKEYFCTSIISQGAKPLLCYHKEKFNQYAITPLNKIKNTTGCGDSFTAGFASELDKTSEIEQAIFKGIECAALNAKTLLPGNLIPSDDPSK